MNKGSLNGIANKFLQNIKEYGRDFNVLMFLSGGIIITFFINSSHNGICLCSI